MRGNVKLTLVTLGAWTAVLAGGAPVSATYDAATNTETLTNQTISSTYANAGYGDLTSYDHSDRNLVINWTDSDRTDVSAICNADVNAKNITINANFYGVGCNRGIISDSANSTTVQTSGDINITTFRDGIYTKANGTATVKGFKNLTVTSLGSYGCITDYGGGITVKGGEGSTININALGTGWPGRPAVSNLNGNGHYGTGISMEADTININSRWDAVIARPGYDAFALNLAAKKVNIKGYIAAEGDIYAEDDSTQININENTEGLVQITGRVANVLNGSVIINAAEDGSFIQAPDKGELINFRGENVISVINRSSTTVNMSGSNSYIKGDIFSYNRGTLSITATGDNFSMSHKSEDDTENLIVITDKSTADVSITGNNSLISGEVQIGVGGTIHLTMAGNGDSLRGPLLASRTEYDPLRGESVITADFSGNNITMTGDISNKIISDSTITANFSGADGRLEGNIMSQGDLVRYSRYYRIYDGNTVNLNMTGDRSAQVGNLTAEGDNTLNASYTGEGSSLTGNVVNKGIMNLAFSNQSFMTGNMSNEQKVYTSDDGEVIAAFDGKLTADFDDRSSWTGSLTNTAGTAAVTLQNASTWSGDAVNTGGTVAAALQSTSAWTGDLTNTNGTSAVTLQSASSWTGNLVNTAASTASTSLGVSTLGAGSISTAAVTLEGGSTWTGDLSADAEAGDTTVTLEGQSVWTGSASGNGIVSLTNGSLWQVTGDSELNSLSLDSSSTVSLAGNASRIETGTLGGTGGTFLMDLVYGNDDVSSYRDGGTSDFIIADGGAGSTYTVTLTADSSISGMTGGSKLYFASTQAGTSAFSLNQSVQIVNYSKIYNSSLVVKKETDTTDSEYAGYDDWFLTPDSTNGTNGNTVNPNGTVPGSAYNAAFAIWRDDDTLLKRLGELRYNREDEGFWARWINKRLERDGDHSFQGNYKTVQVGWDKEKRTERAGNWYYGAAVSHLWGDTNYTSGNGTHKMTDISIYGTNIRSHGQYLDLVGRIGRIDTDYDTSYGDHGEFENWGASISAEYGRKHMYRSGWSIEPQVQLTYNYLWGDNYTTSNGASVHQDGADSLIGRLGFVVSREYQSDSKNPNRVYLKASVLHDFLGDTDSYIEDDIRFTDSDDLGDTWYVVGVGMNIHFSDRAQFYLDMERNFDADVDLKYRVNAGIRWEF